VFIDIGQRGCCLWSLYRVIDSALAEKEGGKSGEGTGGHLEAAAFTKARELFEGEHIFPRDIVVYYKNKKLPQDLGIAYCMATPSMLL
jgi:hypothetical protein